MIDRQKVKAVFEKYTSLYDSTDDKIRLKIEHTYKVSEISERIARELGLDREDIDLAWLAGMLHDIGRFEQLKRYDTFIDSRSIDHAVFGTELLFHPKGQEEKIIRSFITEADYDDILETAIQYHSCYQLPEGLTPRELLFCQILRDADKTDIFRVNASFSVEGIFDITKEELLQSEVSENVMTAFMEEHAVLHKLKKTPADFLVGHISLFFEVVYSVSRQIVLEQGYLQQIMSFQSKNPKTYMQFEIIRQYIKDYVDRKNKMESNLINLREEII